MRFNLKRLSLYLMILTFIGINSFTFAQDFEKVQIETVKVTEGVYLLIGDEFPQLIEKIKAAIAKTNGEPIRIVLNTNWHSDDADGNELLAKCSSSCGDLRRHLDFAL